MSQQSSDKNGEEDLYSPLVERGGFGEDTDVDLHPAVELSTKRREETQSAVRRKSKQPESWAETLDQDQMEYYVQENLSVEGATVDLDKAKFLLEKVRIIVGEVVIADKNATDPRDICNKCLTALMVKGYDL